MSNKHLTIWINGRKALPVRAIPHITSWQRYTPDKLARHFALLLPNQSYITITSYHLSGDAVVPMKPREWDMVVMRLDLLEIDLKSRYELDKRGLVIWYDCSVKELPAGVFVWYDEFKKAFLADRESTIFCEKLPGDDELNLTPLLDSANRKMVMEGFENFSQEEPSSHPDEVPYEYLEMFISNQVKAVQPEKRESWGGIMQSSSFEVDALWKKVIERLEYWPVAQADRVKTNKNLDSDGDLASPARFTASYGKKETDAGNESNRKAFEKTFQAQHLVTPVTENGAVSPSKVPDWKDKARLIADECFDSDTRIPCRDSLKGYSRRVMEEMQKQGIKGPRGIIDNPNYVMRHALQGKQWWSKKQK
jgi:hypothetical protein